MNYSQLLDTIRLYQGLHERHGETPKFRKQLTTIQDEAEAALQEAIHYFSSEEAANLQDKTTNILHNIQTNSNIISIDTKRKMIALLIEDLRTSLESYRRKDRTKNETVVVDTTTDNKQTRLREKDVLFGSDNSVVARHPGTIEYLELIQQNKDFYVVCQGKERKEAIIKHIVNTITKGRGRFLERSTTAERNWRVIEEEKAIKETFGAMEDFQRRRRQQRQQQQQYACGDEGIRKRKHTNNTTMREHKHHAGFQRNIHQQSGMPCFRQNIKMASSTTKARACSECHKAKVKCIMEAGSTICKRCERIGLKCAPHVSRQGQGLRTANSLVYQEGPPYDPFLSNPSPRLNNYKSDQQEMVSSATKNTPEYRKKLARSEQLFFDTVSEHTKDKDDMLYNLCTTVVAIPGNRDDDLQFYQVLGGEKQPFKKAILSRACTIFTLNIVNYYNGRPLAANTRGQYMKECFLAFNRKGIRYNQHEFTEDFGFTGVAREDFAEKRKNDPNDGSKTKEIETAVRQTKEPQPDTTYSSPIDLTTNSLEDSEPENDTTSKTISNEHRQKGVLIKDPNDNDVLGGRGSITQKWWGNKKYNRILHSKKTQYFSLTEEKEKKDLIIGIVTQFRRMNPPGRFLKEIEGTGMWRDMGFSVFYVTIRRALNKQKIKANTKRRVSQLSRRMSRATTTTMNVPIKEEEHEDADDYRQQQQQQQMGNKRTHGDEGCDNNDGLFDRDTMGFWSRPKKVKVENHDDNEEERLWTTIFQEEGNVDDDDDDDDEKSRDEHQEDNTVTDANGNNATAVMPTILFHHEAIPDGGEEIVF